jgi:hypothetical protein
LINRLRAVPTASSLIQNEMVYVHDVDAAVQKILDFQRLWANFHFPRLLRGLDKIQQDLFGRGNIRPGNYEYFATQVENCFLDPAVVALDEYGIPVEVGRKLQSLLASEGNLDATLDKLRRIDVQQTDLTDFEKKLVSDARSFL